MDRQGPCSNRPAACSLPWMGGRCPEGRIRSLPRTDWEITHTYGTSDTDVLCHLSGDMKPRERSLADRLDWREFPHDSSHVRGVQDTFGGG